MKLLIPVFSPPGATWSGVTRAIAIAEAAERAGHEVAFCAAGYVAEALRKYGGRVYVMPMPTMFGLPKPIAHRIEHRSQRNAIPVKPGKSIGSIWLVLLLSGMGQRYLPRLVKAQMAAVEDFQPDKLFTDLDPGAYLVSAITGIPLASAYAHIATHGRGSWGWKRMKKAMNKVLQTYGLPAHTPDDLAFGPSILKLIPSIPELDETDPNRSDVCYVGQLLSPMRPISGVDFQIDAGRRYVFVYVGTGSVSLTLLEEVLPQVFPADGEWHCVVGAQSIKKPYQRSGVDFQHFVPAEELIPHCDWVICHGGQNTILQSLSYGVPLLIFPGPIFERRYNAQKVQEAKGGLMGELDMFTAVHLKKMLARRQEFEASVTVLQNRVCSYGGAETAVAAIEAWSN